MIEAVGSDSRQLDYLSFSVKDYSQVAGISDLLGLDFVPLGHGMGRWRAASSAADRGAFLCSDNVSPDAEDTWFFDIRGSGMRVIEQAEKFEDWRSTLRALVSVGASFKRIDAVADDCGGAIRMETVRHAVASGHVVRKGFAWSEINKHTREGVAQTLYVGSRESDVMLRVYDKGMQLKEDRSWLRFEFELKRERADQWARVLAFEGWDKAYSALRGLVDFREPVGDLNRGRWPVSEWWQKLICESRHVLKIAKDVQATIVKKWRHLEGQCCKSLALVTHAFGGDIAWLYDVIEKGAGKFKRHDRMLLEQYERMMLNASLACGT